MVGGLELAPVIDNVRIGGLFDILFEAVDLGQGIFLHRIAEPGGEVPLDIGPAYGAGDIDNIDGGVGLYHFGRGFEVVVGVFEDFFGQMP
jgi:hypothetical protein